MTPHPAGLRMLAAGLDRNARVRTAMDDEHEPIFAPRYRDVGHSILRLIGTALVMLLGLAGIVAGVVAVALVMRWV